MKYFIVSLLTLSCITSTHAAGVFSLPAIKPLALTHPVGQAPTVTKIPMLETIDAFRHTRTIVPLGSKSYHVSLQRNRGDKWALVLLEVGKRKLETEGANLLSVMAKHPWKRTFGGRDYTIKHDTAGSAIVFAADDNPLGTIRVPLLSLRRAAYEAAVPVPALGPGWRMVIQHDLFIGAGMLSFTFLEPANGDVNFHRINAQGVDSTRKVNRTFAGKTVALKFEGKDLVVEVVKTEP